MNRKLARALYAETMREFAPLADEIRDFLLSPDGHRKTAQDPAAGTSFSWQQVKDFLGRNDLTSNLAIGGAGALAGAVVGSAATSPRKPWESEEEYRRRKFRSAMGYAASTGLVAGLALPAFKAYSSMAESVEGEMKAKQEAKVKAQAAEKAQDLADKPAVERFLRDFGLDVSEDGATGAERMGDISLNATEALVGSAPVEYGMTGGGALLGGRYGHRAMSAAQAVATPGTLGTRLKGIPLEKDLKTIHARYGGSIMSKDALDNFVKGTEKDLAKSLSKRKETVGRALAELRSRQAAWNRYDARYTTHMGSNWSRNYLQPPAAPGFKRPSADAILKVKERLGKVTSALRDAENLRGRANGTMFGIPGARGFTFRAGATVGGALGGGVIGKLLHSGAEALTQAAKEKRIAELASTATGRQIVVD